jgi:hypothetical protein
VLGDGIMALFGAPVAHEDHAVRACYTALRMQEAVREESGVLTCDINRPMGQLFRGPPISGRRRRITGSLCECHKTRT